MEQNISLVKAVETGDYEIARSMLEAGADPDIGDGEGKTPLLSAVILGDLSFVKLLLSYHADPFYSGFHDMPVLMASAFFGHLELVTYFIDMGFDLLNIRSSWGDTSLIYASKRNHPSIVRFLLGSGADVHVRNCYGISPILAAANQGNAECCHLLLAYGALPNDCDNLGRSVLRHAVRARVDKKLIGALIGSGADPLIRDRKGHSIFWENLPVSYLRIILDYYRVYSEGRELRPEEVRSRIISFRKEGREPLETLTCKKKASRKIRSWRQGTR